MNAGGMTNPTDKGLFELSYPLFLQSLVMFAVMAVDMMIWSAHSPETATALSVAGQALRIAVEFSAVMAIGAVVTISRQLGRGDADAARLTAEVASIASAAMGVGLGLALVVFGPMAMRWTAPNEAVEAEATRYLLLVGGGMAFLCFGNAVVASLRGFGMSRLVMVLGVFGAALYLGLEYWLVLGPGPATALGVQGAGIANVATRIVVAAVLFGVAIRVLKLRFRPAMAVRRRQAVREMAALALPSVSAYVVYGFYQMALLGVIATHGEVAVLTRAYVMIAMSFLTLVIMAVSQGAEVMIGYRVGAGDVDAAQGLGMRASWIASGLSAGCGLVIYLASDTFLGLFTDHPAILALGRDLLLLTIFLQPCFAFNMILFHALRAVGDVRWPVIVNQALSWALGLPLAWALCVPAGLGVAGVWYALIAEELVKALAMVFRWQARRRLPAPALSGDTAA